MPKCGTDVAIADSFMKRSWKPHTIGLKGAKGVATMHLIEVWKEIFVSVGTLSLPNPSIQMIRIILIFALHRLHARNPLCIYSIGFQAPR
jgi:hypothetical protein